MEIIITIGLPIVIILQIITIALVLSGKKQKGDRVSKNFKRTHDAPGGENRHERKDGDTRRANGNHRKPHEQRSGKSPQNKPQQSAPQPSAAIAPTENSLRDINLRLKNAEREQENARRKLQDGSLDRGSNDSRGGERQQRPPQQRGGNGGKDDRPPRREFNRDNRRDGRPGSGSERNGRGELENPAEPGAYAGNAPDPVAMPNAPQRPEPVAEIGIPDDLQHGRRFTAKRRRLPDDNAADTPETAAEAQTPFQKPPRMDAPAYEQTPTPQVDESAPQTNEWRGDDTGGETPMFGRR